MEASSSRSDDLLRHLQSRPLAAWRDQFDTQGFVIFEKILSPDDVARVRAALDPYLENGKKGRNDFEGLRTNRVYALLAKSPVFAELAIHPLVLAFAEAELDPIACFRLALPSICIPARASSPGIPTIRSGRHVPGPLSA